MATNYPTSLDSFTNPTSSSTLNSPSHAAQHANANDAIEAIETKLGVGAHTIGEWTSFTPAFTNVTIGDGTVDAKYCRVNKIVFWQVMFTLGSTSAILGAVRVTYPIVASNMFLAGHGGQVFFEDATGSNFMGNFERNSTVSVNLRVLNGSSTYVYHSAISSTVPFTWTTGDRIVIQDFYEVP